MLAQCLKIIKKTLIAIIKNFTYRKIFNQIFERFKINVKMLGLAIFKMIIIKNSLPNLQSKAKKEPAINKNRTS